MPSTSAAPSIQTVTLLAEQVKLLLIQLQPLNLLQFQQIPNAHLQAGIDANNTTVHGHHQSMGSAVQVQDGLELPPVIAIMVESMLLTSAAL